MTAGASFAAEGVEAQTEKVKRSVKFDRGLNVPSSTFIQKGLWTTGFKASYADYNMSNYQFLLIDDILTTGATLLSCSETLRSIPGIRISILTAGIAGYHRWGPRLPE